MTSFEHAMIGVNGALAVGLHRRHGWQICGIAGMAAASPDWDGLTILFSSAAYAEGHRVWGHNLLACAGLAILLALIDYRFDLMTRWGRMLCKVLRSSVPPRYLEVRAEFPPRGYLLWITVAILAAFTHLPADAAVSGSATLAEWKIQPLWPMSDVKWGFSAVYWGDVGVTVIFAVSMFAMVKWRSRVQLLAAITLSCVVGYIALRAVLRA